MRFSVTTMLSRSRRAFALRRTTPEVIRQPAMLPTFEERNSRPDLGTAQLVFSS